jgi:hypothetical protein
MSTALRSELPRWKSNNFLSLARKQEKFIQIKDKMYLFIVKDNVLHCFEKGGEKSYTKSFEIMIDDNIVNYHVLDDFRIILIGKEKKFIFLYDREKFVSSW